MSEVTWSELLKPDGPAALVYRERLVPAAGADAVVFPPTFAGQGAGPSTYNIDTLPDQKVALIDSAGSQANRMEPLFKDGEYAELVPQITIEAGGKEFNLLDVGHRAGDALVRYSTLGEPLRKAFVAASDGNVEELARIAPTSIIFGVWDSRDTQVKLPRLLNSTIHAFGVEPLTRSAQYNPPLDYVDAELIDNADDKRTLDAASELGFRHAPAAATLGGIIVRTEIRREVMLNLVTLRGLGRKGDTGDKLRSYVLGLALVSMTHDRPHNLRQGCLLVRSDEHKPECKKVYNDGRRVDFQADHQSALRFAKQAAKEFVVGKGGKFPFETKTANAAIAEKVGGKQARAKKTR